MYYNQHIIDYYEYTAAQFRRNHGFTYTYRKLAQKLGKEWRKQHDFDT